MAADHLPQETGLRGRECMSCSPPSEASLMEALLHDWPSLIARSTT